MAEEYIDKPSDQNENNYGFPFVEVTPLEDTSKKKSSISKEPKIESTPIIPEAKPISMKESTEPSLVFKKKRSQLPLQFSLVMLILIILSVMAYFLYFLPNNEEDHFAQAVIPQKVEPENLVVQEKEPEILVENQDMETENDQNLKEIVEEKSDDVSEAAPAPAAIPLKSGNINKVTAKAAVPQYFIIVSSTASEKVALEEAQKLIDNNNEAWVIYPYGETTNYRLAIGKYAAFAEATEAMEKRKADFDASIWILKY
jgi:uncharacterized protein (UPF0333 family)